VGSAAREGIGLWFPTPIGGFPSGVLIVNIVGSFLLGVFLARRERAAAGRWSLQFWAIGVLGSFTTFSTFSVDVVHLVTDDRLFAAGGYVVASVIGGLVAALLGQRAGSIIR